MADALRYNIIKHISKIKQNVKILINKMLIDVYEWLIVSRKNVRINREFSLVIL